MPGNRYGKDALKTYEMAERQAAKSTVLARRAQLSPSEIAAIRAKIAKNVTDYLPIVDEVIRGTRDFSPTQARIFTALLNKVVPDLSATHTRLEIDDKRDLSKMSMAELEQIAAGVALARSEMIDPDDVIEAAVVTSAASTPEPLTTLED